MTMVSSLYMTSFGIRIGKLFTFHTQDFEYPGMLRLEIMVNYVINFLYRIFSVSKVTIRYACM